MRNSSNGEWTDREPGAPGSNSVKSLVVFDADHLAAIGASLGKRHPDQQHVLALTQANYQALVADPRRFVSLGVRLFPMDDGYGTRETPL